MEGSRWSGTLLLEFAESEIQCSNFYAKTERHFEIYVYESVLECVKIYKLISIFSIKLLSYNSDSHTYKKKIIFKSSNVFK